MDNVCQPKSDETILGCTVDAVIHEWAVVGAGACGIIAVASLLHHIGVSGSETGSVVWIDPEFCGGDLPNYCEVPASTVAETSIYTSVTCLVSIGE